MAAVGFIFGVVGFTLLAALVGLVFGVHLALKIFVMRATAGDPVVIAGEKYAIARV